MSPEALLRARRLFGRVETLPQGRASTTAPAGHATTIPGSGRRDAFLGSNLRALSRT